jgi:hypothetical protein
MYSIQRRAGNDVHRAHDLLAAAFVIITLEKRAKCETLFRFFGYNSALNTLQRLLNDVA